MVGGGGEAAFRGQTNNDVAGILSQHRMGSIVVAAVIDNDDLFGLRVAQPKRGEAPQRALAALVCGNHHGNAES